MILSISRLHKSYSAATVLGGVDLRIERGEKVALVGRNGSGKTTLLRIIAGLEAADSGSCTIARGIEVGYLRQDSPIPEDSTVLACGEAGRKHVLELKARLDDLEARIGSGASPDDLDEYAALHEHFLDAEGYSAEREVRTVLSKIGFAERDFDRASSVLSGGEKTRLALAALLLREPDLLILDEPTNHLDLEATEWLENWVSDYRGAVLVVSHDREFLQAVAKRTVELSEGVTKSYAAGYEKYLLLREADAERRIKLAEKQQREIERMEDFVRRFINSERTAQARGKRRIVNRLIGEKARAPQRSKSMAAGFGKLARAGDRVVECRSVSKSYSGREIFADLDWVVQRGEKWGVVGTNGSGKSTLVRIVLNLEAPDTGSARLGANVSAGYFAQDSSHFDAEQSPLDVLTRECGLEIQNARNLLGRFLFSGDQAFQPIRTLSGGERNKLSLAELTALCPNLLVLDEPTNHLDADSRQALAEVLQSFEGTILLVSHDRWLLSQVTNRTLDIRPGVVTQFSGSYAEYRDSRTAPKPTAGVRSQKSSANGFSQHELSKEIVRLQSDIDSLEAQVSDHERELRAIERALSEPTGTDVFALSKLHARAQSELDAALLKWEKASALLTNLRSMQGVNR